MSNKKFKLTPQSEVVMEYLEGNETHPSAEEIYNAVKRRYPMVSMSSVFKTLETLKSMGIVWELSIDDEKKRYDPNVNLHHHIICLGCREILDMYLNIDIDFDEVTPPGYRLKGHHVEFYGVCPKCQEKGIK